MVIYTSIIYTCLYCTPNNLIRKLSFMGWTDDDIQEWVAEGVVNNLIMKSH